MATTAVRSQPTIDARASAPHARILTLEALEFVADLHRRFEPRRRELLSQRVVRQRQLDAGVLPGFLDGTRHIREADWTAASIPPDLEDRRVEITGPTDRKLIIDALNSGANVFMADFEDATSPTWGNVVEGQLNLYDAVRRTISFTSPGGKRYALNREPATLMVRPRGWHLPENHCRVDGEPVSASLFDFGLFFFHNAHELVRRGTGPYFYLPKLESHLEARLWNDVFVAAQEMRGLPQGTIRATVLIENILAAFEMDEILWELRRHSTGLNGGRWDYIFSVIRKFRAHPEFVLPDRDTVTMERRFLASYVKLLVRTCHRRGVHAMGGMAAQIPIKGDPEANARAVEKVRRDKLREVVEGHDGTWVAHPGLVDVAREVFDAYLPTPNQIHRVPNGATVTEASLLEPPPGPRTERGLRHNVDVGLQYLGAWLSGVGCVPIYDLMEDAATAEISRSQVWQWVHNGVSLDDGRPVTSDLVRRVVRQELQVLKDRFGGAQFDALRLPLAASLLTEMMTAPEYPEWLTLTAYEHINGSG